MLSGRGHFFSHKSSYLLHYTTSELRLNQMMVLHIHNNLAGDMDLIKGANQNRFEKIRKNGLFWKIYAKFKLDIVYMEVRLCWQNGILILGYEYYLPFLYYLSTIRCSECSLKPKFNLPPPPPLPPPPQKKKNQQQNKTKREKTKQKTSKLKIFLKFFLRPGLPISKMSNIQVLHKNNAVVRPEIQLFFFSLKKIFTHFFQHL